MLLIPQGYGSVISRFFARSNPNAFGRSLGSKICVCATLSCGGSSIYWAQDRPELYRSNLLCMLQLVQAVRLEPFRAAGPPGRG